MELHHGIYVIAHGREDGWAALGLARLFAPSGTTIHCALVPGYIAGQESGDAPASIVTIEVTDWTEWATATWAPVIKRAEVLMELSDKTLRVLKHRRKLRIVESGQDIFFPAAKLDQIYRDRKISEVLTTNQNQKT